MVLLEVQHLRDGLKWARQTGGGGMVVLPMLRPWGLPAGG